MSSSFLDGSLRDPLRALHFSAEARSSALALVGVLASLLFAGCRALEQPPDEKPTAREMATPSLTLRRSLAPPSASATPEPELAPSGAPATNCCDALRAGVVDVGIEEESALLYAALECDKMAATKNIDAAKLRALLGGIPMPASCR